MKKILTLVLLAAGIACFSFAQDNDSGKKPIWDHGDNVASITYQNVNIYRIYDTQDAYIVLYAKQGVKVGQVSIPKDWAKQSPRKLEFRTKPKKVDSYMTIIKQDGEYLKVWLNVNPDRRDSIWAVAPHGVSSGDTSKETLEIEY